MRVEINLGSLYDAGVGLNERPDTVRRRPMLAPDLLIAFFFGSVLGALAMALVAGRARD
jgi:hypothetical protein